MNSNHLHPIFTTQDASRIAGELYGLQATAQTLPGELDHNFYLRDEAGREFVLKISHTGEQQSILDLQNKALEHLAAHDPSLFLPRLCLTSSGQTITTITAADGTERFVRLLTYVPGRLFAGARPGVRARTARPSLLRLRPKLLA